MTILCVCCGKELEEYETLELSNGTFCGIRCQKKFMYAKVVADCFICHEKIYDCQPRANVDRGSNDKWVHLSADKDKNCYLKWCETQ